MPGPLPNDKNPDYTEGRDVQKADEEEKFIDFSARLAGVELAVTGLARLVFEQERDERGRWTSSGSNSDLRAKADAHDRHGNAVADERLGNYHKGVADGIRQHLGMRARGESTPRSARQRGDGFYANGVRDGYHTAREVSQGRPVPSGLDTYKSPDATFAAEFVSGAGDDATPADLVVGPRQIRTTSDGEIKNLLDAQLKKFYSGKTRLQDPSEEPTGSVNMDEDTARITGVPSLSGQGKTDRPRIENPAEGGGKPSWQPSNKTDADAKRHLLPKEN